MNEKEILEEIERLKNSPYVKLAKKMENKALRQRMYQLRSLEKKGKELAKILGMEGE